MGHGPHSSKLFVLFYVLCVFSRSVYCLCVNAYCTVLYYCHRVATQLQLTNMPYYYTRCGQTADLFDPFKSKISPNYIYIYIYTGCTA